MRLTTLTERQRETLNMMKAGFNDAEIARALGHSTRQSVNLWRHRFKQAELLVEPAANSFPKEEIADARGCVSDSAGHGH